MDIRAAALLSMEVTGAESADIVSIVQGEFKVDTINRGETIEGGDQGRNPQDLMESLNNSHSDVFGEKKENNVFT